LVSEGLGSIQQLIIKGNYSEALKLIDKILAKKNTSPKEKITAKILKGVIFHRLGLFEHRTSRFDESITCLLDAIEESEKVKQDMLLFDAYSTLLQVYYDYPKIDDYLMMFKMYQKIANRINKELKTDHPLVKILTLLYEGGNKYLENFIRQTEQEDLLKQAYTLTEKAFKIAEEKKQKELTLLIIFILYDYSKFLHLNHLLKLHRDAFVITHEIQNDYWKAKIVQRMGYLHYSKGDIEELLELTKKAMEIDEKNGNEYSKVTRYLALGRYHYAKYENAKVLEYCQKALATNEESNNVAAVRQNYQLMGDVYERMGQLDKALKNYRKSQELFEKVIPFKQSYMQSKIANIYVRKGELEAGLALQEEMLEWFTNNLKDKLGQASILFYLKDIYWYKGELEKAINYTQRSLKLFKEMGREDNTKILYALILITKEANKMELAKEYLEERKEAAKKLNIKTIDLENKFLEAVLLKESTNTRDWVRAELLFEQLLEEELHYFLKVDVLINLCNLLLIETMSSNDTTALEKVKKYLTELHQLAAANEIPFLLVESMWLQSKLALLDLEVEKAQELIAEALKIANEKGLERLKKKLQEEQENIKQIISQLIKKGKETLPLAERINLVGISKTFKEVKKQRILNTQEEESIISGKLFSLKI
jgi:tetratricopeptide (TPR) repeat protein